MDLLKHLETDEFWESLTVVRLNEVRTALRTLVKYLDPTQKEDVITHFRDELSDVEESGETKTDQSYLRNYRKRVESFIRDNQDHLTIHKLNTNVPITLTDIRELEWILFEGDLGTKEDYFKEYGEQPLGTFIRTIVGLNIEFREQVLHSHS